jgi:hypothetical protein
MIPSKKLQLSDDLSRLGLQQLGHCLTKPDDQLPHEGTLILIGPDEPSFWPGFIQSDESRDERPDPIDRWSRRVLTDVAVAHDATALFPFGGPPYQPIFTWALRSGRFWSSPIGFLVHDAAGLFVSFRGVLLVKPRLPTDAGISPCKTCAGQPCLTVCPVDAFDAGYDVPACKSHLAQPQGHDCMTQGCRSRRACPIGQGKRLPAQATHHMKAFL